MKKLCVLLALALSLAAVLPCALAEEENRLAEEARRAEEAREEEDREQPLE